MVLGLSLTLFICESVCIGAFYVFTMIWIARWPILILMLYLLLLSYHCGMKQRTTWTLGSSDSSIAVDEDEGKELLKPRATPITFLNLGKTSNP